MKNEIKLLSLVFTLNNVYSNIFQHAKNEKDLHSLINKIEVEVSIV